VLAKVNAQWAQLTPIVSNYHSEEAMQSRAVDKK
jgi:hypothetical protein